MTQEVSDRRVTLLSDLVEVGDGRQNVAIATLPGVVMI